MAMFPAYAPVLAVTFMFGKETLKNDRAAPIIQPGLIENHEIVTVGVSNMFCVFSQGGKI